MIARNRISVAYAKVQENDKKSVDRDYYGTPPKYIELARSLMGSIELDPASCQEANQQFVKANRFFDQSMDGLSLDWTSKTLFLNPPYSRRGCFEFAMKFEQECQKGNVGQAVVLVNSATGTRAFRALFRSCNAICFVDTRIQFIQTDGRLSQKSNTKEQLFFYRGQRLAKFRRLFGSIGQVVRTNWR